MIWRCRDHTFDLAAGVRVMAILNVTPDSFSDGGRYFEPGAAIARAHELLEQGADLLDLGAESTRPGSEPVPAAEQWRRLEPVLGAIRRERPAACVSVDTASAEVAARALAAGAHVVNDVTALGDPAMAKLVADAGAGLVLMHMQGSPATMQRSPHYDDVVREIGAFFGERLALARAAGVADEAVAFDPGVGFGKALAHTHSLLGRLDRVETHGRPILVGVSRKSFIMRTLGGDLAVEQRLEGALAATAIAVLLGARVVRTHDVTATRRAIVMAEALRTARAAG